MRTLCLVGIYTLNMRDRVKLECDKGHHEPVWSFVISVHQPTPESLYANISAVENYHLKEVQLLLFFFYMFVIQGTQIE